MGDPHNLFYACFKKTRSVSALRADYRFTTFSKYVRIYGIVLLILTK